MVLPCQVYAPCVGGGVHVGLCIALVDLQQLIHPQLVCVDRTGCSSWECTLTSVGGAKVATSDVKRKIRPAALVPISER